MGLQAVSGVPALVKRNLEPLDDALTFALGCSNLMTTRTRATRGGASGFESTLVAPSKPGLKKCAHAVYKAAPWPRPPADLLTSQSVT